MESAITLKTVELEDDDILHTVLSLLIRRRTQGMTPVLLVCMDEEGAVSKDTVFQGEDFEWLISVLRDSLDWPSDAPADN